MLLATHAHTKASVNRENVEELETVAAAATRFMMLIMQTRMIVATDR